MQSSNFAGSPFTSGQKAETGEEEHPRVSHTTVFLTLQQTAGELAAAQDSRLPPSLRFFIMLVVAIYRKGNRSLLLI